MGAKNVITKKYISDDKRFADLFNYYIYNGERIIQPECLVEKDPSELIDIVKDDQKNVYDVEKFRDVLKGCVIKQSEESLYILMGAELQSNIHYAMPVRNGLYDFIDYASQIQRIAKKHRKARDLSGAEFLSGIGKCDKIKPVITLVVYLHEGDWDGPRSLYEMLDTKDENILRYVSDYKLNILVPKEIEHPERFQTDLRYVMEYIKAADDKNELQELLAKNHVFSELGKDEAMVLKECIGANFEETDKEGKVNMCIAYQQMLEEGRQLGIEQGRKEEKESQMNRDVQIIMAIHAGKDIEEIAHDLEVSEENVRAIAQAMQQG